MSEKHSAPESAAPMDVFRRLLDMPAWSGGFSDEEVLATLARDLPGHIAASKSDTPPVISIPLSSLADASLAELQQEAKQAAAALGVDLADLQTVRGALLSLVVALRVLAESAEPARGYEALREQLSNG